MLFYYISTILFLLIYLIFNILYLYIYSLYYLLRTTYLSGAAFAAGLAVGFWKDLNELSSIWRSTSHWVPLMDAAKSSFMVSTGVRLLV